MFLGPDPYIMLSHLVEGTKVKDVAPVINLD